MKPKVRPEPVLDAVVTDEELDHALQWLRSEEQPATMDEVAARALQELKRRRAANMESVEEKIRESNRIESIYRDPTPAEIAEYERFVSLRKVTIEDIEQFVSVYAPGNVVRDEVGCDVRIGRRVCRGGPHVRPALQRLLDHVNTGKTGPYMAHIEYELLHPITDGNGRSGRQLWYQIMKARGRSTHRGFLHEFYYQTLQDHEDP